MRAPNGDPTGILKDNAQSLVDDVIPDPPPELADKALQNGMQYVASHGVTSVVNMGYTWWDLGVFQRAQKAGKLITRFYAVAPLRTWEQLRDTVYKRGHGDEWIQIGGLKAFVDGSIGSHTALMLRPFNDAPNDSGLWVTPADDLYAWTSGADRAGLQVMVHAIGDRAIRTQLDIFARVEKENGPRDRRFRIEHAQHLSPQDIPRFAELGVIPSMQPYHAIDDGRWVDSVIGKDRSRYTYAFRSLIDAKATLAFGSDWSVAPAIPLYGIYAAVTRRTLDDKNPGGWVPEEKITVEEALRAYTINGAYAEFQEKEKGSIEVGKLADFAMIDRDITTVRAGDHPRRESDSDDRGRRRGVRLGAQFAVRRSSVAGVGRHETGGRFGPGAEAPALDQRPGRQRDRAIDRRFDGQDAVRKPESDRRDECRIRGRGTGRDAEMEIRGGGVEWTEGRTVCGAAVHF